MSTTQKHIFNIGTYLFAAIGLFFIVGFIAIKLGLTNTQGTIDQQSTYFLSGKKEYARFPLAHTPEWIAFRQAVAKDKSIIDQISKETGVPARLLVAILVPEQMRLFHSERPIFKQIFEPLKILGSQSQFSWGIFGIKDDTARAVEDHLRDTGSPFYLGKSFEHALDFISKDTDQERFARIIDEHNHTYGYKYAALYIAQIEKQWNDAGFPINEKPEVIATLWNLGFGKSLPNSAPRSGGSTMNINDKEYSFGSLAGAFYNSDELIELFPIE